MLAGREAERAMPETPSLLARDPAFHKLVPAGAAIEKIGDGFKFSEGPVYSRLDYLLFSDVPDSRIVKWTPRQGFATFRQPSHQANGLTFDRQGRLLACEGELRRVTRTEKDGAITVLADRWEGKKLNRPNDIVEAVDGSVYFSDPLFSEKQPTEIGHGCVFQVAPRSGWAEPGRVRLVVEDMAAPNGITVSPDQRILYVDDSLRAHVKAFDIRPDGSLANGRIFAELPGKGVGAADGMKCDERGNLYVTGVGQVWVFTPEARHLGSIVIPDGPSNCAFGYGDYRALFITARPTVWRLRVEVPGARTF